MMGEPSHREEVLRSPRIVDLPSREPHILSVTITGSLGAMPVLESHSVLGHQKLGQSQHCFNTGSRGFQCGEPENMALH
jgi:hypothetical protein